MSSRTGYVRTGSRTAPFVVEFVGAPGAGKTTLVLQVAAALRAQGFACRPVQGHNRDEPGTLPRGRLPRAAVRLGRLTRTPGMSLRCLPHVCSRAAGLDLLRLQRREALRRTLRSPSRRDHVDASYVVLLDEGCLHKVMLMAAQGRAARPGALARSVTQPDLCVLVDAGVDTAMERIRGRPVTTPVDRLADEALSTCLERYRRACTSVLRELRCPVVRVDALGDGVAASVADAVTRLQRCADTDEGRRWLHR